MKAQVSLYGGWIFGARGQTGIKHEFIGTTKCFCHNLYVLENAER